MRLKSQFSTLLILFFGQFSPGVIYALEHDCLTETQRREFVRDICTDISSNGVYFLNKEERNKVSLTIVTRYPHLKDSIGSGLVSIKFLK